MTPQQIRQRRRQKILARSQQQPSPQSENQQEQQPLVQQSIPQPPRPQSKPHDHQMSSYQRFQLTKQYQQSKNKLSMIGLLAGFISAIIQYLFEEAFILFFVFLIGICINIFLIEKMFSEVRDRKGQQDSMIKQLENIKQITLINKIANYRQNIKPVLKCMSGYMLTVMALGFMEPSTI